MSAAISRFRSRWELLAKDENDRVRAYLAEVERSFHGTDVERRAVVNAVAAARRVVDLQTASRSERSFVMLYPPQNRLVVEHLTKHSRWPKIAPRLWAWLFEFVSPVDGEVLITREGLIERVGASRQSVDGVLRELVEFGALTKLRVPEPGKQGRGRVQYFMNARVGSCNPVVAERERMAREAPLLKVIDGAQHPSQRRERAAGVVLPVL